MAKTFEGRSRLVNLAYQVLNKIEVVVADKSDGELMAVFASEFHRHEVAVAELSQLKSGGRPKLPEALTYPHAKVAA